MSISLHIERLILDDVGIKSQQQKNLKAAIVSELERQLVSQGTGAMMQLHHHQSLRGRSMLVENGSRPTTIGQQIGNAVYKGISK